MRRAATVCCAGLAVQPMFGSGRVPLYDPRDRVTPTGILRRLGQKQIHVGEHPAKKPLEPPISGERPVPFTATIPKENMIGLSDMAPGEKRESPWRRYAWPN